MRKMSLREDDKRPWLNSDPSETQYRLRGGRREAADRRGNSSCGVLLRGCKQKWTTVVGFDPSRAGLQL
ncbi:unnamed protein product [Lota lota]